MLRRASCRELCRVQVSVLLQGAQPWVAKTTSDESPLRRAAELVEYEGSMRDL